MIAIPTPDFRKDYCAVLEFQDFQCAIRQQAPAEMIEALTPFEGMWAVIEGNIEPKMGGGSIRVGSVHGVIEQISILDTE
ncbi:hypothetical protein AA0229_1230 [Gluconobacter cerinus NRIC 0229]|uniref:Uncharacterized protein n=2 Tax=Acetobacteraceae TaxID=433 RepID=A0AAV5NI82_9PROT|nr:hypothetical protein [Acetobacter tropicalis]GBR00388.1 hypothetical protein AA0229_1230 [Gluconobacter cerinus NRIC 0229]GLQ63981.1 hypothetical protein GCM10007867_28270 [Gluconobacter cerinus]KXV51435.1 hypothetical protein AD944_01845 [Acetobacter tropicalis]GAL96065.1 hypothetical protein ATR1_009d0006 [Acetobacter tropicalis]GBR72512.1 hypothetical protein AA0312_2948 [Acetobacter tropicalis NRIC 0312]